MVEKLEEKAVLVTGADGFIGSHLCEILVGLGAKVTALVHYNSWSHVGWLADIDSDVLKEIHIEFGDVRDVDMVSRLVGDSQYVFHLASLISIPYSYHAPRSYLEVNAGGTLNVLEAVRRSDGVERMLHVSTSETYGSAQYVPMDERHPLVGQSPYAASKIAADQFAESYARSFDTRVITARPFNTFGPRQTARAVIPTVLSQLALGASEICMGSLDPTRDFNFVTDTAKGMIDVMFAPFPDGSVVNIGSGMEISIGQFVNIAKTISRREDVVVKTISERVRPAASEVNRLVADSSFLRSSTSWEPSVPFEEGVSRTYDWIKENKHLFSVSAGQN